MSITPVNASVTVTTAGTRVQVSATTSLKPTSIYFEALGTNTGCIYVGLVSVTSTLYIARLSPGQGYTVTVDSTGAARIGNDLQLSAFYLDSSVSGEKCLVTYMHRVGASN